MKDILGWKTYPGGFYWKFVNNCKIFQNRTGEITAGAYFVSIIEIVSDCQQKGTGALLIINNYLLGLLWGNQCCFLFESYSKDEIGIISATGTAVLLNFDSLQPLENYIKIVYYSNYPTTLYIQVQFLKLKCTDNTKSAIKSALKSEKKQKNVITEKKSRTREENIRS